MSRIYYLFAAILLVSAFSCRKDEDSDAPDVPKTDVTILVDHDVDGEQVIFYNLDQKPYINAAGNEYEITRLEYYLSDFKFRRTNGSWHSPVNNVPVLIDVEDGQKTITLSNVEVGDYNAMSVMIGVMPKYNKTGLLENNLDNLNMAWPENLGGGYHFMKFEGNYKDDQNIVRGFTVHLGNEGLQSVNEIDNISLRVESGGQTQLNMSMNLNEWYKTPHLFDFNKEGNYTMAIDSLMELISENGTNSLSIMSIQ